MSDARRVGTFFSGLFLYSVSVGGASMLSQYHLPRETAKQLGGRESATVIGIEALLIALLVFMLSLVWSTLSLKPPKKKGRRSITSWFYSGILAAWLAGLLYGVFFFAMNPRSYQTMADLLLSSDTPPLWGVLNTIALLLASLIGGKLARKLNPPAARSSRRSIGVPVKTLVV
ncbi:hypothetical protein SNE35_04040 [Paucibacter sp. R3-3]|uniref:Uncharacterized protein n=1 Tax=Roseateles agri TaxID=3098619 RepID=A0ABU5DD64_9BURK|nr:hypothetical protein [Paucibacter sp. R3-3]MDY0743658.1 hypothetical protein [Paucibacter sp. R3-3]